VRRTQIGPKYIDNNYKPWRDTQMTQEVEVKGGYGGLLGRERGKEYTVL
jgi:hypothetical protein